MDLVARMPLGTPVEVLVTDGGEPVSIVRLATPVAGVSMVGYPGRDGVRSLLLFDEGSRAAARSALGKGDPMEPLVDGLPYIRPAKDEVIGRVAEILRRDAHRAALHAARDGGFDGSLVPAAYRAVLDEAVGGIPESSSNVPWVEVYPREPRDPRTSCPPCLREADVRIDWDAAANLRFSALCLADREAAVRLVLEEVVGRDGFSGELDGLVKEELAWDAACGHVRERMGRRIDAIAGLAGSLGAAGKTCLALFDGGTEVRMYTDWLRDAVLQSGPGPISWATAAVPGPESDEAHGAAVDASDGLVRVTFCGRTVWEAQGEPLR